MLIDLLIQKHHFENYHPQMTNSDPIVKALREKLNFDGVITVGTGSISIYYPEKVLEAKFPIEQFLDTWRRKTRAIKLKFIPRQKGYIG